MNTEVQAMFKRFGPVAMLLALVPGGLLAFGYSTGHEIFFQSYLYGFVFWGGLTLGCFGFTLLHQNVSDELPVRQDELALVRAAVCQDRHRLERNLVHHLSVGQFYLSSF